MLIRGSNKNVVNGYAMPSSLNKQIDGRYQQKSQAHDGIDSKKGDVDAGQVVRADDSMLVGQQEGDGQRTDVLP